MNPDLEAILAEVEAALADPESGWTEKGINSVIAETTDFPNIFALRMAVGSRQDAAQAEGLNRVADRGALANTAGMALNDMSFGLIDNLIGLFNKDAGEGFRTAVEENRELAPGASMAAGVAGGAALPSLATARFLQHATPFVRGASTIGAGAASAGALAFGEADDEDVGGRLGEAARAAPWGALMGAIGGAAGATSTRALGGVRRRANRVGAGMTELSTLPDDLRGFTERSDRLVRNVRERHYRPLESQFPAVTGQEITQVVDEVRNHPDAVSALRRVSREVTQGDRAPSFEELQKLQDLLHRQGRPEAGLLEEAMRREIPGYREANDAYRRVVRPREAFEVGLGQRLDGTSRQPRFQGKGYRARTAFQIERALEALPPEQHRPFLMGRIQRELESLRSGSATTLDRMLDMHPGTEEAFRAMFSEAPDGAIEDFLRLVRRERSGARVARAYRLLAPYAAAGAIGAAGYGIGRAIGDF